MKKLFLLLSILSLMACGSKIEGKYFLSDTKAAGKVYITLDSGGKGTTNIMTPGSEHGLKYEVSGDKITMRFEGGDQGSGNIWTIKDGSIVSPYFGEWIKK